MEKLDFKRKIIITICFITIIMTSSCKQAPPIYAKDEIISYQWQIKDISGEDKGIVTFSDGKIKISDKNLKFSENCMVEDDRIIINSNDYGVIILNYKMYGDILELEYFGKKITLNKK